ncbi:hypothetical protein DFH07DRAFT_950840 [Mycena maculata]|uniref:Transmembrane protein n=1 Tax=Mycena maculata TaxID=230809 RepID=A0AAD7K5X1_9AGAR|nr:hypothetical protein DFH07DRAFT_950840 [Mycena maculata]
MQFTSRAAILRLTFIGLLCVFSLVDALPAAPNSTPVTDPGSLLGHSYSRRDPDSPALLRSPRLAGDAQTHQLDGHGPLGRADRFQISRRRAAPPQDGAEDADTRAAGRSFKDLESREVLLSHEQMVPTVPRPAAFPTPTNASSPPLPSPTIPPSPPPAPQDSMAPGARVAETHESKKTKTKTKHGHGEHDQHKAKVSPVSAE